MQDVVQALVEQVGLRYDRPKSFAQTDPLCRRWVNQVAIHGTPCREALDKIFKPVELGFKVDQGTVVLSRLPTPVVARGTSGGEEKLSSARAALRTVPKDTARAQKLLLEIVDKDKDTLQPGSLCYAYVYLGYIADRATSREQAAVWFKRALEVPGADPWIRDCAEYGVTQRLTWIQHLDAN